MMFLMSAWTMELLLEIRALCIRAATRLHLALMMKIINHRTPRRLQRLHFIKEKKSAQDLIEPCIFSTLTSVHRNLKLQVTMIM